MPLRTLEIGVGAKTNFISPGAAALLPFSLDEKQIEPVNELVFLTSVWGES